MRRRAEDTLVGVAVTLGLGIWVLSVIWKYLLIGGAVAVVGALSWLVVRRHRAAARHNLVQVPQAALPAADSIGYRQVVEVDPTVFDDPVAAEVAALGAFRSWASRLPRAPKDSTDLVSAVDLRTRIVGRFITEREVRDVVWRHAPYGGRKKLEGPPLLPDCC